MACILCWFLIPTNSLRRPFRRHNSNIVSSFTTENSSNGTISSEDKLVRHSHPRIPTSLYPDIQTLLDDIERTKNIDCDLTTPCHLMSRDSSYTKSWTLADWDRHNVKPLVRYVRHIRSWSTSSTARSVIPIVLLSMMYSIAVCLVAHLHRGMHDFLRKASLKSGLLGSFSSPIALLLTLRTNRAMDRLLDGRKSLGLMNRATRTLTGLYFAYVAPYDGHVAILAARYIALLPWCLKALLRGEDDELCIRSMLPSHEVEWLMSSPSDNPTAILARLRMLTSVCSTRSIDGTTMMLQNSVHLRMCELLYDLEQVVGINKRILGSPIPPTFTRHTSRLLCVYLSLLPFSLLGFGISMFAVIITCALTTYIMVGIDEIGLEIENALAILPMHSLCQTMQKNVMDQVTLMRDMPDIVIS